MNVLSHSRAREEHQQKKLSYDRYDKLIMVQHNKLIAIRHNKLTSGQPHGSSIRKARTIFRDSGKAAEIQRGGGHTSAGSFTHPSGAPSCERLSPGDHKRLVHPKP